MTDTQAKCELCGEPMPEGETMFKYHGYSGPCPKPPANLFRPYRRKQIAELRRWEPGDDMSAISVSAEDAKAGSPKDGDMIARNPKNHADQWLVAAQYFADNFDPA